MILFQVDLRSGQANGLVYILSHEGDIRHGVRRSWLGFVELRPRQDMVPIDVALKNDLGASEKVEGAPLLTRDIEGKQPAAESASTPEKSCSSPTVKTGWRGGWSKGAHRVWRPAGP